MCTLIVWRNVHPDYPVVVAANRDEDERRPATGPRILSRQPLIAGGLDIEAGGTWLAVSAGGYVVALTNRRGAGKHDPSKRSRGKLVLEVAQAGSVSAARERLRTIDARDYNPFVLLALDVRDAIAVHGGELGLDVVGIGDGVHVVTNWDLDSRRDEKARHALELAQAFPLASTPAREIPKTLWLLLQDHVPGPKDREGGLCVHLYEMHYRTRSSAIVLLGRTPPPAYYYVEGHPCEGALEDVSSLLTA